MPILQLPESVFAASPPKAVHLEIAAASASQLSSPDYSYLLDCGDNCYNQQTECKYAGQCFKSNHITTPFTGQAVRAVMRRTKQRDYYTFHILPWILMHCPNRRIGFLYPQQGSTGLFVQWNIFLSKTAVTLSNIDASNIVQLFCCWRYLCMGFFTADIRLACGIIRGWQLFLRCWSSCCPWRCSWTILFCSFSAIMCLACLCYSVCRWWYWSIMENSRIICI